MPLVGKDNLDELYARHRLLQEEATRLLEEYELARSAGESDRCYILDIEIRALQEEATAMSSRISDILERDLQR